MLDDASARTRGFSEVMPEHRTETPTQKQSMYTNSPILTAVVFPRDNPEPPSRKNYELSVTAVDSLFYSAIRDYFEEDPSRAEEVINTVKHIVGSGWKHLCFEAEARGDQESTTESSAGPDTGTNSTPPTQSTASETANFTPSSSSSRPSKKRELPPDDSGDPKRPRPPNAKPVVRLRWLCPYFLAFGLKLLGDKRYKSCLASQIWSADMLRTHLSRTHHKDHEHDQFTMRQSQWDECLAVFADASKNRPRKEKPQWKEAKIVVYRKIWRTIFPVEFFPTLEPPRMPFDVLEPKSRGLLDQVKILFCALQCVDANSGVDACGHQLTDRTRQNLKDAFAIVARCSQPDEITHLRSIEEASITAALQDPTLWLRDALEGDLPISISPPAANELTINLKGRAIDAELLLRNLSSHPNYQPGHRLSVKGVPANSKPQSELASGSEQEEVEISIEGPASDAAWFAQILPSHPNYQPDHQVFIQTMSGNSSSRSGVITSMSGCHKNDDGLRAARPSSAPNAPMPTPCMDLAPSSSSVAKGKGIAIPDSPSSQSPEQGSAYPEKTGGLDSGFISNADLMALLNNAQDDTSGHHPQFGEPSP
ncbi:hypothetical protein PG995_004060 [Apiospora arundinis]